MKCKTGIVTCMCGNKVHCMHWSIIAVNYYESGNLTVNKTSRNIIHAISFECLKIWYAKHFHLNVMKFTAFTKHDMGVVYIYEFSKQSENLLICYNFILS